MTATGLAARVFARRGAAILFEEDFDLLPAERSIAIAPPEPEVIEPTFTAAEMKAACEEARREVDALVRAELTAAREQAVQAALSAMAEQLRAARSEARSIAETSAEAIAQMVMAGFAAAFPALCGRFGGGEVSAVIQEILPMLDGEPRISIRVCPDIVPCVTQELERLDSDVAEVVKIIPVETMAPGDIRLQWRGGQAVRDTARLWHDIEAALAPAGLLPPLPDTLQQKLKENVDGE